MKKSRVDQIRFGDWVLTFPKKFDDITIFDGHILSTCLRPCLLFCSLICPVVNCTNIGGFFFKKRSLNFYFIYIHSTTKIEWYSYNGNEMVQ